MSALIAFVIGTGLLIYVGLLLVRDLATGVQYLVKSIRYREVDYEQLDVRGRLSSRSVWATVLFIAMLVFLNPFIPDFGPSNRLATGMQGAVSAIGIWLAVTGKLASTRGWIVAAWVPMLGWATKVVTLLYSTGF